MKLRVVIIDDKPRLAGLVELAVKSFVSSFTNVYYEPYVICGFDAYEKARKYILANQQEIDILMIDYNIETNLKGTELFKLIDNKRFEIYRILHSITSKSHTESKDDFRIMYDQFNYSKDTQDIIDSFTRYEKEILSAKLFGNSKFHSYYFIAPGRVNENAKQLIYSVPLFDILYAKTEDNSKEEVTFYYRSREDNSTKHQTKTELTIKRLADSGMLFKRVSSSLVVNLLWVSKIDVNRNTIRFITCNNERYEIDFIPTGLFDKEVKEYLTDIETINSFFAK